MENNTIINSVFFQRHRSLGHSGVEVKLNDVTVPSLLEPPSTWITKRNVTEYPTPCVSLGFPTTSRPVPIRLAAELATTAPSAAAAASVFMEMPNAMEDKVAQQQPPVPSPSTSQGIRFIDKLDETLPTNK